MSEMDREGGQAVVMVGQQKKLERGSVETMIP